MMSYETQNLARRCAEGFFAVYVKEAGTEEDKQNAIAALTYIFQNVYAHGMSEGQMKFALNLISMIGQRSSVPANELLSFSSPSSLK